MSIEAVCPACMSVNEIDEDLAGTKVRCDECNKTFTAPTAKQAKKTAQAKTQDDADEPEPRASTGANRQQFLMSLVMAFVSFLAFLAVAGLGVFQIWSNDEGRKPVPAVKPNK